MDLEGDLPRILLCPCCGVKGHLLYFPVLPVPQLAQFVPVYVRGEAYLAGHESREAAAEFQKILDHLGIVLNEPIGAVVVLSSANPQASNDSDFS